MKKRTIELTEKEAHALLFCAGNFLDFPDTMNDYYTKKEMKVPYSAADKIQQAFGMERTYTHYLNKRHHKKGETP